MNIRSLFVALLVCWADQGLARTPMALQAASEALPNSQVLSIESRPGVHVPLFVVWNPQATATVVLFSGGGGGYGSIGADGWPSSQNFLIRSGKLWAGHPFNVVMVGRPSDGIDLHNGAVRIASKHSADNDAVLAALKARSELPLWVVGTSMGTISAAAAAIQNTDNRIAGVVLTSSVTGNKIVGSVPSQSLDKIRVPTLVVHHRRDACHACTPWEAKNIPSALRNAPVKALLLIDEGGGESGDACEALHFHGYVGAERSVVDQIARWIENPTP